MALSEHGCIETQALEKVYEFLQERDPTFPASIPLTIPNTNYKLLGKRFEAFFKLSLGSIANMVLFLEGAHSGVLVRKKDGTEQPLGARLKDLIEAQVKLTQEINKQVEEDRKTKQTTCEMSHDEKAKHVRVAKTLIQNLKSLPR